MSSGTRRGVFFCAVVGRESEFERTCLRFIGADGEWRPDLDTSAVKREVGACLRMIECSAETAAWYPALLRERV